MANGQDGGAPKVGLGGSVTFADDPVPSGGQGPVTPPDRLVQGGSVQFTQPNPYDPSTGTVPTWDPLASHEARMLARTAMSYVPFPNAPFNAWNLGQSIRESVEGVPGYYIKSPGEIAADVLNLPKPETTPEKMLSSGVGWGVGGMTSGQKFATALRQLPTDVTTGVVMGTPLVESLPPWAQWGLGTGMQLGASRIMPGTVTTASPADVARAQYLRSEGVPVIPADLGPGWAKTTYSAGAAMPGSGSGSFVRNQFNSWADAVARRFGGQTEGGLFTDKVIGDGFDRVDDLYNQLRSGNDVPADTSSPLFTKLSQISHDVNQYDPGVAKGVDNYIHDLLLKAQGHGGVLPASDVVDMLAVKSPLSRRAGGANDQAGYYEGIREAISDAFGNTRTGNDTAVWTDARNSFRSLKTVEAARNPSTDVVTPEALAAAANPTRKYQPLANELSTLAKAADGFITPPAPKQSVGAPGSAVDWRHLALGLGEAGFGLGELSHVVGLPTPSAAAAGLATAVPVLGGINRVSRAGALGPPAPTYGQYAARALTMPPSMYVNPNLPFIPPGGEPGQ